jgi:arachidonate 15-lipoxygenase (second type)/8-lipoxygenase (S-type)
VSYQFADNAMLKRMNLNTRNAAAAFKKTMDAFSTTIKAREFGCEGLSQGMPFLWQGLDPNVAPFGVTI